MRLSLITACLLFLTATVSAEDTTTVANLNADNQIQACRSENSLDMLTTFKNAELDKTGLEPNVFYTLMTDKDDEISVHVRYEPCTPNEPKLCNCAVYVKVGNDNFSESKYALIDFCDANPSINSHLRFYSTTKTLIDYTTLSLSSSLPTIDCNSEIEDASDPEQWSAVNFYQGAFKCAKLVDPDSNCQSSYLQASSYSKSVLLKLDTKCKKVSEDEIEDEREEYEYLNSVMIIPPEEDVTYVTGGLCGNMVKNLCHLFDVSVVSLDANSSCVDDVSALGTFWTSTFRQKMHLAETFSRASSEFECTSFNYDPSLNTFSSSMLKDRNFRLQDDFNNSLILYEHNLHTMVNVKYSLCNRPFKNAKLCNCAAYVRLNRTSTTHFAFIDVCKLRSSDIDIETFSYYTDATATDLPYEKFNCSSTIEDENNEDEWKQIPTSFGYFKCATLRDNTCKSLVLKTVGDGNSNIIVKVDAHCKGISESDSIAQVAVSPSVRSEAKSNGLCGKWIQSEQSGYNSDEEIVGESTSNTLELTSRYNTQEFEKSGLIEKDVNNAIVHVKEYPRDNIIDFSKKCRAVNDPYISSFGRDERRVHYDPGYFVFYSFYERIRIITGFENRCSCAIYLTVDPTWDTEKTVYINFCNTIRSLEYTIDINSLFINPIESFNDYKEEYCHQKNGNPLTEQIWNDWPANQKPLLGVFQCIKNTMTGTNYIRVVREPENQKFEALAVLYSNLHAIEVHASFESVGLTEGECGPNNGRSCELMYRDDHNNVKCASTGNRSELNEFNEYWRVKPNMAKSNPKGVDPQLRANEQDRMRKIDELESRLFPRYLQKFDVQDARDNCESEVNKVVVMTDDPQIDDEIKKIAEDKIQICTEDLSRTGDSSWAKVHADTMKTAIMEFIVAKREFFDEDMVLKDETLSKFKITCPRNCVSARNGKCVKNNNCRFDTGCDYMVKCECNSPYSSSDCSVNVNQPPEFWLAQKCCNSRTMNCDTISLFGDFSDTEEITVRLESETDSSTSVNFLAKLKNKNQIDFKFPYGKFPSIKESHHRIKVGVTYGKSDYTWQTLDFYDSRCRTCDEKKGVSEEPIEGKCISQSGVCSSFVADNTLGANASAKICWEPKPCNSVFDVGLIVHSSDYAGEQNYDMIKDSMAEMLGRFNLGRDKVHVGMMYYGKRVMKTSTLARKDQFAKKLTTDRAQSIPYVPIPASPVSQALRYAHDVIFTNSRANSDAFPRVAVLLNYKNGDDGDATGSANLLKSKKIELMTIGVGNQVNSAGLEQLASTSPVLVHRNGGSVIEMKKNAFVYRYPSEIFNNLPELVERVCSMSAKTRMNVPSRIEFSERFAMNYFQVDIVPDAFASTLMIEINTLKGYPKLYCSYTNPNPTAAEGCTESRRHTRDGESEYLFLDLPLSPKTLYFAIESFEAKGDFKITVSQY